MRCRDAATEWFARALAMERPGCGVAGFPAFAKVDMEKKPGWVSRTAFLDGAIGLALSLLAAISPVEPQWDRLLLLSGRSGSGPYAAII